MCLRGRALAYPPHRAYHWYVSSTLPYLFHSSSSHPTYPTPPTPLTTLRTLPYLIYPTPFRLTPPTLHRPHHFPPGVLYLPYPHCLPYTTLCILPYTIYHTPFISPHLSYSTHAMYRRPPYLLFLIQATALHSHPHHPRLTVRHRRYSTLPHSTSPHPIQPTPLTQLTVSHPTYSTLPHSTSPNPTYPTHTTYHKPHYVLYPTPATVLHFISMYLPHIIHSTRRTLSYIPYPTLHTPLHYTSPPTYTTYCTPPCILYPI